MMKILKYVIYDVLRSKMIIAYTLFLFLLSSGLFWMNTDSGKTVVSLLHVILLVVPLISIVFGTIHYYNSREFTELLLAQPINRNKIFLGEYAGLSCSLAFALLAGMGVPVLISGSGEAAVYLVVVGILLTFIFTALAFLASVRSTDKARGIGTALLLWFYFAVLFDGIVLSILFYFNDYPLEKPVLFLTALNPVDLARVITLLKLDTSALMGYTGALYQKFFGSAWGISIAMLLLLLWLYVPLTWAKRIFFRKDL
ncbi:MAG: ABC transporter permease subunit [Bacteroidetes bacterium]|nr:ABC transporter permease subunit [Bacteroidota bacterium]